MDDIMTTLRNRMKNPKTLVFLGCLLLALGSILRLLTEHMSANLLDGLTGLLYGMSFAFLLMSVIRKNRRRASPTDESCPRS